MDFEQFIGHKRQQHWFANAIKQDRLASSFLMCGPVEIGKRTFAKLIAKTLFCQRRKPGEFSICNACEGCAQVNANTHPDLIQISKPPDKATLPLDLLIGADDRRGREGLCHDLRMKPFYGQRRIAIIDDADLMPTEAANSLLKTLEEPPAGSLIFLISRSEQRQLPTIRSRTQTIRFNSLPHDELASLLIRTGWVDSMDAAAELALRSDGTLALARQMQNEATMKLHEEIEKMLEQAPLPIAKLSKMMQGALKSAGDDGQAKRDYLRMMTQFVIEHFRKQLRNAYVQVAKRTENSYRNFMHPETAVTAIASTLQVQQQIDRNLTAAGLIEAWVAELANIVDVARAKRG